MGKIERVSFTIQNPTQEELLKSQIPDKYLTGAIVSFNDEEDHFTATHMWHSRLFSNPTIRINGFPGCLAHHNYVMNRITRFTGGRWLDHAREGGKEGEIVDLVTLHMEWNLFRQYKLSVAFREGYAKEFHDAKIDAHYSGVPRSLICPLGIDSARLNFS